MRSHLDYVRSVIAYQTNQNKQMGVKEAEPVLPSTITITKLDISTDWRDINSLLKNGRQELMEEEKESNDNRYFQKCDECNIVFRREDDVGMLTFTD